MPCRPTDSPSTVTFHLPRKRRPLLPDDDSAWDSEKPLSAAFSIAIAQRRNRGSWSSPRRTHRRQYRVQSCSAQDPSILAVATVTPEVALNPARHLGAT